MKNKLFLGVGIAGCFITLASVASAADMVVQDTAPVLYDWSGAYIGVSGGYLNPNADISFQTTKLDYGKDGGLIGGTVGYNYQVGKFVFGAEADLSYARIRGNFNNLFGFGFDGSVRADYLGTVRGRIGYAMDNIMVYGTGGAAFTKFKVETALGNYKDSDVGYTVGAGIEYGFTPNLTAKAEYLFSDFGKNSHSFSGNVVKNDFQLNTVRVGLNYKF